MKKFLEKIPNTLLLGIGAILIFIPMLTLLKIINRLPSISFLYQILWPWIILLNYSKKGLLYSMEIPYSLQLFLCYWLSFLYPWQPSLSRVIWVRKWFSQFFMAWWSLGFSVLLKVIWNRYNNKWDRWVCTIH